jgi:uncharacterized membrane protein YoaT (DUF817 family)
VARLTDVEQLIDAAAHRLLDRAPASRIRAALVEFLVFGAKQAWAALFGGILLAMLVATQLWYPAGAVLDRNDLRTILAVLVQVGMVLGRLETLRELRVIVLFHIVGTVMELFKTDVGSWIYPPGGVLHIANVPLFSGFMYAAIGSYIVQAWRLLDIRVRHHPPYWMATTIAILIYLNFFTHHYIGDYRWYLAACALGLYSRTTVVFRPLDRDRRMPLMLGFVLTGFFIWMAENIGTFWGVWRYPNQLGAWSAVHISKWSSWSLLVIMTFTIVASLKHVKAKIHIAEE